MQPPLWPQLLLQVILIAINAYFAATEIAVISLNEAVIRHQAEEGDKKAARLLHIVEQPTGFLSTIQIGITLAGFLGSAFAADNLAGRLSQWFAAQYALTAAAEAAVHTLSVILITIILSFFTLVFGAGTQAGGHEEERAGGPLHLRGGGLPGRRHAAAHLAADRLHKCRAASGTYRPQRGGR